jgi:hypothetical protein
MKGDSPVYGRYEWPWWHDVIIIGVSLAVVALVTWLF